MPFLWQRRFLLPIFNSIEVLLSSFTPAGNHSIGYIISYHNGDLVNSFLHFLTTSYFFTFAFYTVSSNRFNLFLSNNNNKFINSRWMWAAVRSTYKWFFKCWNCSGKNYWNIYPMYSLYRISEGIKCHFCGKEDFCRTRDNFCKIVYIQICESWLLI